MTASVPDASQGAVAVAWPESLRACRRRASVLILVMTLLGVLFVTGIMFLATVNFEANMIEADRQRDRDRAGIQAVVDELGSILRDGLVGTSTGPFVGSLDGNSKIAFAELPAYRSLISPIEPYHNDTNNNGVFDDDETFLFGWFTDLEYLTTGRHEQRYSLEPVLKIDTSWDSGVPDLNISDYTVPVDADGDGITDTLAVDVQRLGFGEAQIAALSEHLNGPSSSSGRVYLGLRVIPHGGMVNLNESHPELIANVLNVRVDDLGNTNGPDAELGYFRHRPMLNRDLFRNLDPQARFYSTAMEEATLRRRFLLPPRMVTPSLLQGNPYLDQQDSPYGEAELATRLFPPGQRSRFETVYEDDHRHAPFSPKERYVPGKADSPPLWAVRMEPFTSEKEDDTGDSYDRRHLVTTISYDDLLSRGGDVEYEEGGDEVRGDVIERMRQVDQEADEVGFCPDLLPFEYIDYPHDIVNATVPNEEDGERDECDCPTRDVCRFDPRKGRLKLSLAWLDDALERNGIDYDDDDKWEITIDKQRRLIHDVFMLLVRNASGPYWDDIDCSVRGTNGVCPTGESCDRNDWLCHDEITGELHSLSALSRTAASLTANMLSYAYDNRLCLDRSGRTGDLCVSDLDCPDGGRCYPYRTCKGGSDNGARCLADDDCGGGACYAVRECDGGGKHGQRCVTDDDCAGGTCRDSDDGLPTRVRLRSFDFSVRRCFGGTHAGDLCSDDRDCGSYAKCALAAGWDSVPTRYVYGLERQPFITEVASSVDGTGTVDARAVELFNPYEVELPRDADRDGQPDYWLIEVTSGLGSANRIPLREPMGASQFTVFRSGITSLGGSFVGPGRLHQLPGGRQLNFTPNTVIYLVRRVTYPGDVRPTEIVVDQFKLDGADVGVNNPPGAGGAYPATFSRQRSVQATSFWMAPIPVDQSTLDLAGDSLVSWNTAAAPGPPVEVNFANAGRFAPDPRNERKNGAFPTTGSILLLMRHANRSLDDYQLIGYGGRRVTTTDLAFTTWLDDQTTWRDGLSLVSVREVTQVDNGRMPVFDLGDNVSGVGQRFAHHVDPAIGACCLDDDTCFEGLPEQCPPPPNGNFVPGAECSAKTCALLQGEPGDPANLPWGQFVFDYFTALPLRSLGPYIDPEGDDKDFEPGAPGSIPRVDLNGLRVHGRININAAPWKVLAGLPLMPAEEFPRPFRGKLATFALSKCDGGQDDGLWCAQDAHCRGAGTCQVRGGALGEELAQSVVAYRELREVLPPGPWTGNYALDVTGRGWDADSPAFRRGTGFITVGELANIRHSLAGHPVYRVDAGVLDQPNPDFVEAMARVITLSDWVTTRSQVFTVYGTLRGELDEEILGLGLTSDDWLRAAADVDTRAIRFQETVDRLPTFMGERVPVRVGERTVGRYMDVRND